MMMLAHILIVVVGLALIGSAVIYACMHKRLNSDPILVAGCMMLGTFCLVSGMV
jgi:hypothetical protein